MKLKELKRGSMKILQKIVAAVCAVAVTATMTSPISIGDNSAGAEEIQLASNTTETVDSSAALAGEEKPMSGKCGDNLTWVLDDEGTLTISGTGEMWDFSSSPSPWDSCSNVKSVIIEEGVTSIGDGSFGYINSLISVTIPNSVTSIFDYAFLGCSSLTTFSVGANNSKYCSKDGVLFNKSMTKLIQYPSANGRTNYTIPDGVFNIEGEAFNGCIGLTSVIIPDSVVSIGCGAFNDCIGLTSVTIPDGVEEIDYMTFIGCIGLTSVAIPDSITIIGSRAFEDCSSLTSVTIPNSVKLIGDSAFSGCSSLASVTIPDSVTYIGADAFSGCSNLTLITIPDNVTAIGASAFSGCSNLTSVKIPDSVTEIRCHTFNGCSSLTSVTIPNSVTRIDFNAFYKCNSLTSVTIPNSVTHIGEYAFVDCSSLTSITISNSVTSIDRGAFSGCSCLTSITIPCGVASIDECLFLGCSNLTSVTIPDGITSIGNCAFSRCDNLTSVTIPATVTNIGYSCFYGCSGLVVYYADSEEKWQNITLGSNNNNLTNATIHYNSTGPNYDEQAAGNVRFLSSYDPETGKVGFDESSTHIGLDYTLSDTIDKELAASLAGKYVLAEIDSDSLTVTDLKPVESKIGTISAIDKMASTITIDGEVYPLSRDNSVLTLFADLQIGKMVLYHIYQGDVVGCNSIEKQIGMLKSWDYTNQELVIDDIVYPINFLTDISFLANVDQLFGKKVVFVGSSCNEQFFVFKLVPYTEMLNTPPKDVYTIEVGSEGTIYANIPLQSNALSVDYSWISSDGKIVSFVQGLSLSNIDGTYSGNMSVKNAIISIPFYACSEGEASVTCTLADGTAVAVHKIKVVKYGSNEKVIESNNYNVYKYSQNSFENYNQYIERWYDAYEKYIQSILNAARQSSDSDYENNIEKQAKAMMQLDEKSLSPNLTFDELKPSAEVKLSAYKALCETIQPVVDKQINLDKIDLKDTTSFSSSTCKAIANAAFKTSATYEYGDVVVEVSYGGLQIGVGSMACYKKNKPYDKHYVMICPTLGSSTKCIEDYLTQLVKLEYKAIDNVYNSLAKDICGKTLSKLTAEYLGKKFTKQLTEKIKAMGAGDIKGDLITLNIAWKNINNIGKKVISNEEITLEDLGKLKNCIEFDDSSIEDRATKKALKAISKAQNDLYDEINRVVSNHAGEIKPPKKTLPQMIKSWFTCPVNISIYKDGEQIGYVGDDDIWYNDDIYIEERGGAKIIYSTPGDSISFKITGNDDGLFSYSIEEYDSNKPTGRVNFYNIPVENGKSINVDLPTSNLADNTNNFKLEGNSASYLADEYIPVNDSAGVNIKASVRDNTGGQIHGSGEYVRGDAAVLYAIPDEKYIFNGWFDTNGKLVSIANVYEFCARDDGNYIAYFSLDNEDDIETYTISFTAVGGITSDTMLTTDENGKLSKLPVATRDGYIFDGWFTAAENGQKITTDTVFTKDTTVYAHWTKKNTPPVTEAGYKITFNANGGTASSTELTTDENGKLNSLPTATRTDYTFDGWFTVADNGNKITAETVFTADTTVYAHWTKNTGASESPSIPDTSDSSNSDDNGTDSVTSSDSGENVDSGSSVDSEVSSGSYLDDTSNNSKPGGSTSGTDSDDLDTNNPSTGVTVAIIPILLAAGASVVIFRKKDRK